MKFISKRLKTHNVQKQVETVASSQILTLHFVVLSFDRYSRDDVVGEVMGGLEGIFFLQFLPRSWWSWRGWTSPPLRPAPSHWPGRSPRGATSWEARGGESSLSLYVTRWPFSEAALIKVKIPYYWVNLIQPAASRVTVVVLKARNLPKMDITGLSGLNIQSYFIIWESQCWPQWIFFIILL